VQGVEEPGNQDLLVGWEFPAQPTQGDAINKSRTLRLQRIDLEEGDCLLFFPKDGRSAYGDNRGGVTISIFPFGE
jgi:hypothetical protein